MTRRSVVLAALVALAMITYLDRVCIAIAGPRMQEELGISPERWGWVMGVFSISYGLFEIPSGGQGDRIGHRRVLTRIVVWWSAFTTLTGLVSRFPILLATRFLFGVGEAGAFPNMAGVVGRWFPADERGRAQGFLWAASRLGGALTPWVLVPIMARLGWRPAFWIFGGVGVAWASAWFAWYRDPLPVEGPPGEEQQAGIPWGRLFRTRQVWLLMTIYWFYVWGSMFYLTWLPTYLVKGRGLTETEMGKYVALPFLLGAGGNLVGGWLTDRLTFRFGARIGRRVVGSTSLALSAALLVATACVTGKVAAVVLLGLGLGVMDCMLPAAWATCLDIGKEHSGAVAGAMNSAGQAGGFACSVLFGYLVEWTGGYDASLFAIAGMVLVSAVLFARVDPGQSLTTARNRDVSDCTSD